MKTNVYSLYDHKAEAYTPPFFMQKDGMAIRAVGEVAQDRNTNLGKYPTEYSLFRIGEFDDAKGQLIALSPVLNLGLVASMKPTPEPEVVA